MRIYLTHPKHGAKHAYAESEALADEQNGWVRQEEAAPTVVNPVDLQKEVRNKPGPKPKAK